MHTAGQAAHGTVMNPLLVYPDEVLAVVLQSSAAQSILRSGQASAAALQLLEPDNPESWHWPAVLKLFVGGVSGIMQLDSAIPLFERGLQLAQLRGNRYWMIQEGADLARCLASPFKLLNSHHTSAPAQQVGARRGG